MLKQFLEAGQIVSTHGIKGELKVMPWCDSPEFFCRLKTLYLDGNGNNKVEVVSARVQKNMVLLKIKDVKTVEEADTMRNKVLFLDRKDVKLPKGACFRQDMFGIAVIDAETGAEYGKLTDIFETGANDVYEITDANGKKYLFPAVPSMISEKNVEEGFMKICPIKGIFDDED